MINNLAKNVINKGGSIKPLYVPYELSKGTGQTNPSIFIEENKILINLRGIQYVLLHSENEQRFPSRWGPLAYMNPENDKHLRTTNFYLELDEELNVTRINTVDTSKLDIFPVWEFIGLEDARLVKWEDKWWLCGVRRDTKSNGEGRMEMSEIIITGDTVKEVNRYRIEPPKESYCEKNWMPVLDKPFHYVKWTNPTEVVKVDTGILKAETVYLSDKVIPKLPDLRGGSSVIRYKDNYIAIVHEVNLFKNELGQKDAFYYHRFVVWDEQWNLIKVTGNFNFMESRIEFCCGMGIINDKVLISFGVQDNAAYLLSTSLNVLEELLWNT
jgi:hypothetical protein